jgi:hypothetical protein
LIDELKHRDMKLIMDLVVNHTSDQVRPLELFALIAMADLMEYKSTPGSLTPFRQSKVRNETGTSGESQSMTPKESVGHQTTGVASSMRLIQPGHTTPNLMSIIFPCLVHSNPT